jgi:hypothetical protein
VAATPRYVLNERTASQKIVLTGERADDPQESGQFIAVPREQPNTCPKSLTQETANERVRTDAALSDCEPAKNQVATQYVVNEPAIERSMRDTNALGVYRSARPRRSLKALGWCAV